jgi:hypothetical protein
VATPSRIGAAETVGWCRQFVGMLRRNGRNWPAHEALGVRCTKGDVSLSWAVVSLAVLWASFGLTATPAAAGVSHYQDG